MKAFTSKLLAFAVIVCAVTLLISGCATKKFDSNGRVRSYTYAQGLVELGPPDKQAKLSDGKTVAEWIERRSGSGLSIGVGAGSYGSHTAPGVGVSKSVGSSDDHKLTLTFDKDGRLSAWTKNY